ncbi:MAG: tetratricopeptide repeat protein, partial [Pyrinomonadaceae bacterium]
AHTELRNYEQAMADYNKAIQLDPKDAEAYYRRGNLQSTLRKFGLAATDFTSALRLDPKHPYAKRWLDHANAEIAKATPKNPPPAQPIGAAWKDAVDEGNRYLAGNDPQNAIRSFRRALTLVPTRHTTSTDRLFNELARAEVNENLARSYKLAKNVDLAIETYAAAQKPLLGALTSSMKEMQRTQRGATKFLDTIKVEFDVDIALYGVLQLPAVELVEIGRRALDAFPSSSLSQAQSINLLEIGLLKMASAELAAQLFLVTSDLNYLQADLCRGKSATICGAGSPKNQIAAYSDAALKDINKAISFGPGQKNLYLHRAKVYRFMGRTNLAVADETKAAQLKG